MKIHLESLLPKTLVCDEEKRYQISTEELFFRINVCCLHVSGFVHNFNLLSFVEDVFYSLSV